LDNEKIDGTAPPEGETVPNPEGQPKKKPRYRRPRRRPKDKSNGEETLAPLAGSVDMAEVAVAIEPEALPEGEAREERVFGG